MLYRTLGFNLLSPAAVTTVLPLAGQHQVGIVVMCAVRTVLGPPLPRAKLQRVQDVFGPVQRNVQPERVAR
jgi:hypothetical protein